MRSLTQKERSLREEGTLSIAELCRTQQRCEVALQNIEAKLGAAAPSGQPSGATAPSNLMERVDTVDKRLRRIEDFLERLSTG